MKQCDLTKGFVVFLTIMITFFCGLMPSAWASDVSDCDACKDKKFKGCYGLVHTGVMVLPGPDGSVKSSITSTGIIHFDKENLTGYETVKMSLEIPTDNGPLFINVPPFEAEICGTYEVDDNCNGKAWICAKALDELPPEIPTQMAQEIAFVITNGGKRIQIMTTKMNTSCCVPPCEDPEDPCDCAKNLDNYPMGDVSPISLVGMMEPCIDD